MHGFFDGGAGAGEVDAHAVVAGGAESFAVVEAESGGVDEFVGELLVGESQFLEVNPEQVGGFVAVGLEFGQVFVHEVFAVVDVIGQILTELVEPFGAVGVGGLRGDAAEDVAVDVDGIVEESLVFGADVGVRNDDFGGEHAGEVEGFARCHAGDGVLCDFFRKSSDGRVLLSAHHQVGVDFVADEEAVVFEAEFGGGAEFFRLPRATERIVRVADNHHLRMLFQLVFQIVVVHHEAIAVEAERVEEQFAPVFFHHFVKRRIDGCLDEHFVALFGEILH